MYNTSVMRTEKKTLGKETKMMTRKEMTELSADRPPEDAEQYGNLKFSRFPVLNSVRPFQVKAWRGKQSKPYDFYGYKTVFEREEYIARQKEWEDASQQGKADRKATQSKFKKEMAEKIKVGTLLHASWGYDQTQCEYFQVTDRKGMSVTLREIGGTTVEGSEGFMCCSLMPDRDRFISEPFTKRITANGIKVHSYAHATPCDDGSKAYSSWYA